MTNKERNFAIHIFIGLLSNKKSLASAPLIDSMRNLGRSPTLNEWHKVVEAKTF